MSKLMFCMVVMGLAGCATTGDWRELRIDGSSELAFDQSLSQLNAELSYSRREMFALALVDIARTEAENPEQSNDVSDDAYTDEEYRSQLDGLTYEGVIALADQAGPPIRNLYYSGGRRDAWAGRPWPQTDPGRFPATTVMPPGL